MPLPTSLVGASSDLTITEIDPRWTMAYAAALDDLLPCYMDTRRPDQFIAHPLFPVCFEWPVILAIAREVRAAELTREEALRGVHATHDLLIYQPIRPPMRVATRATIVGVERRKAGAYQVTRLDTTDDRGARVCTSWYGSVYRGVET